ncbi:unnamed protein product [Symbiodinium natans]|uniref:Uncharacterized protein n=1 Tax=Symbiodinium natans TaxID=878477 RepID=A0A812U1R5_9DINO|nr:unnamed protein product [Symbiodinium natans]
MRTIHLSRLGGRVLALDLSDADVEELRSSRDLKKLVAAADPNRPCARLVRLVGKDGELKDDEPIDAADLGPDSVLQYLQVSWMSELEEVPALAGETIPEGVWPNADERPEPWTLFAPDLAALLEACCQKCATNRNFDSMNLLADAWRDAVLNLSIDAVCSEMPSLLKNMLAFSGPKWRWESSPFQETIWEVVPLLQPDTVQRALLTADTETMKIIWESVRTKFPQRHRRSTVGMYGADDSARCIAELISKGLPRWCWAGHMPPFNDNLLQYILEPTDWQHIRDKDKDQARICILVAERLTLEELCHLNDDGRSALSYAVEFAEKSVVESCWMQVRDVIKRQMILCFREETVPVPKLRSILAQMYREWWDFCEDDELHFREVVAAFEEHLRELTTQDARAPGDLAGTWSSASCDGAWNWAQRGSWWSSDSWQGM